MSTASVTVELSQHEHQETEQAFGRDPHAPVARPKQKWNNPKGNTWRVFATFISFAVVGANDGVYGGDASCSLYTCKVLISLPIRDDFGFSTTVVSLIFMTPFAGYMIATALVNKIHMSMGQRGIAIIAPLCHLIPFIVMAVHPPYPVTLVAYVFVGLGNGMVDAAWNAWIADMVNPNIMMGFLQAFYGLGATVSPTIATVMINSGLRWNTYYYTMIGGSALELVTSATMFWQENAQKFRVNNPKTPNADHSSRTLGALKSRVTWIMAIFLFTYMGVEVSVGGWIVDFMVQVRHGGAFESGLVPTGFWAGVTIGRIVLGLLNEFLGERVAITIYLVISIALELVFWLVPTFVASAVAISLLGFFTGPLFPGAIVVTAKLLPKHLHTPGIGIASALAGCGGAILPFVAGAIAGDHGVESLQPFILALLAVVGVMWLFLPRAKHAHQV